MMRPQRCAALTNIDEIKPTVVYQSDVDANEYISASTNYGTIDAQAHASELIQGMRAAEMESGWRHWGCQASTQ